MMLFNKLMNKMNTIHLCMVLSILSHPCSCLNQARPKFEQKVSRFWEFNNQTSSWVEVKLPYDLVSCTNGSCTVVGSIQEASSTKNSDKDGSYSDKKKRADSSHESSPPQRKRFSLTRMSEASIWVVGLSGSIYERFWNGIQWVIAPHDLPFHAGQAASVFIVNQTILALSENGLLYQMHLNEESQPMWIEFRPRFEGGTSSDEYVVIYSGILSNSREKMYFCSKEGFLLELTEVDPPRWARHGRPPGAKAAVITDAAIVRQGLLFIVSSSGDLYEYDRASKPPWKKHVSKGDSKKKKKKGDDSSLIPMNACGLYGLFGPYSASFFFLTKRGELLERRFSRRKWRWLAHGNPESHPLTSITCNSQNDDHMSSLFLTSASGFVFEYLIQESPGNSQDQDSGKNWLNHEHPPHAKVAAGASGVQIHSWRTVFPLHDGRLGELHLSGFGGESLGPNSPTVVTRRKSVVLKYLWSVIDVPESEGWNSDYCTEERGPTNCLFGTKDEASEPLTPSQPSRRRKDFRTQHSYLLPSKSTPTSMEDSEHAMKEYYRMVRRLFRLRLMEENRSFVFISDDGQTLEYLNTENGWFWLRHENSKKMDGAVGSYNASLFLVDEDGSLLVRERSSDELAWINCTSMRKGRRATSGPPWDGLTGRGFRARPNDSVFLVSKSGRLLQLTVASKRYKWKDCKSPQNTKIASIADQEGFRENIVFTIGEDGRLYQYNKVAELWHEHSQSQHLVLSRSPGTAMRSSSSLKGSLFMLSENGGLVEYKWSSWDGWDWIEHGTPSTNVSLVGAPGPCLGQGELFLIGSNGNVYLRYLDLDEWKWRDYGFPCDKEDDGKRGEQVDKDDEVCIDRELAHRVETLEEKHVSCNPKVASTRPIPFSEDSVIFELQDGRLAEMEHMEDRGWVWSRTIDTPTSSCTATFWTSLAI